MSTAYCQYSDDLLVLEKKIYSGDYKKCIEELNNLNTNKYSLLNKAFYTYLLANCYSYNDEPDKAIEYYLEAKKQYSKLDSIDKAMSINIDLAFLISSDINKINAHDKYVDEYFDYATKQNNPKLLARGYMHLANKEMDNENFSASLKLFLKAKELNLKISDKKLESTINNNIATLYSEAFNKPDSALYYLKEDLKYIKSINNNQYLCYNYINQAAAYYYLKDHKTALRYLKKADSIPFDNHELFTKKLLYDNMHYNYEAINDYENAYNYLALSNQLADSINLIEQNIAINDIQTKYQVKEKELENEVLKSNIKTNRILLYSFLVILLISIVIGFLIIKNYRKREKISRQEKLIEQQKLDKALKDYELHSIDMMLEGQEKERQRIANDLHDNLGSMLAALKLNFENLRLRRNEVRGAEDKLYDRTDTLIEEAYQKVRSLAHAKNAGVFANEGLIPALKKLAEKISIPGRLAIEVTAFGFNKRLENKYEITIFRIIQELATNIIKHSKASEASVQLTHHDDNINIIIEDNGIGFKQTEQNKEDGMGLQNIIKKTEQLGGTFNIDSTPGKGTTIIIDIPI